MDVSGLIFVVLFFGLAICTAVYAIKFSGAGNEFDVWFPTKYQRTLYERRNDVRNDWLDLVKAIEYAERMGMSEGKIKRLKAAKDNARAFMDIDDNSIKAERARIADLKKFDKLLEKWGD